MQGDIRDAFAFAEADRRQVGGIHLLFLKHQQRDHERRSEKKKNAEAEGDALGSPMTGRVERVGL